MNNFITLTELTLEENNKERFTKVHFNPSDIQIIKDIESTVHSKVHSLVYLKNFKNPTLGFSFTGPLLVTETADEIDKIRTDFYSHRKTYKNKKIVTETSSNG